MSSFKRTYHFPQQPADNERPWLLYPDKAANSHSRSSPRAPSSPNVVAHRSLNHKRSSSKLGAAGPGSTSSMSLTLSNSSSDSLAHPHTHQAMRSSRTHSGSSKPRTLSEELSFSLYDTHGAEHTTSDTGDSNIPDKSDADFARSYPSPVTPSDLLSLRDRSASSTSLSSTSTSTSAFPLEKPRPESPSSRSLASPKQRPSPLSINTSFSNFAGLNGGVTSTVAAAAVASNIEGSAPDALVPGGATDVPTLGAAAEVGPVRAGTSTLPKLSHNTSKVSSSSASSSSGSASSYSNASSPSTSTPPCSAFCQHKSSQHSHSGHHHHHHHHHHPSCHKASRHHPTCQHYTPSPLHSHHSHGHSHRSHHSHRRHGTKSKRASRESERVATPDLVPDNDDASMQGAEDSSSSASMLSQNLDPPLSVMPASTSTVTIVTPAFGIAAYRAQRAAEDGEDTVLGLYNSEPPSKRARSAASILLGAAVETVIFTGAVALSAYQLLTGRGRLQLQQAEEEANAAAAGSELGPEDEMEKDVLSEKPMMHIESLPVNIPRRPRHSAGGEGHFGKSPRLGSSLHQPYPHHPSHRKSSSRHPRQKRRTNGGNNDLGNGLSKYSELLAMSLPHYGPASTSALALEASMPVRPNTGTEDNDEQFLRMEAKLTTLIAEGKRALN
ncbi:hypothetical protein BGW38_003680, partial [Lunasporangiospora selenospora]